MRNKIYIITSIFFLLIFITVIAGCGGGSATVNTANTSNTVINPVITVIPDSNTSVPQQEVISTLTEISTNSSNVPSSQGAELTHEGVKIQIPPDAVRADTGIKISTVSIQDRSGKLYSSNESEHGPVYKISSGSPDKIIELSKPVKIEIQVDSSYKNPGLAFWSGYEWLPVDKEYVRYDSNTNTVSTCLNRIGVDKNDVVIAGDVMLPAANIVTVFPDMYIDGAGQVVHFPYNISSSNNHFTIHYGDNTILENAQKAATDLENGYNYYQSIGLRAPRTFDYTDPHGQYSSSKIMVYIQTDMSGGYGGYCGCYGYMVIQPAVYEITSLHELCHLVHSSYAINYFAGWLEESATTTMSYYAYSSINNITKYGYFPGCDKAFKYHLDKFDYMQSWQYDSHIFWTYVVSKYGAARVRDIISVSPYDSYMGSMPTLQQINDIFNTQVGESLASVYFEAFEDCYIYGQVFNKNYFYYLDIRDPNEPLCAPDSGYSSAYNYEAFNSGNNPYYNGSTVAVEHLSGECFNFRANGNQGGLSLTVTPANTTDFKVKYFVFKNNSGLFEFLNSGEYVNSSVNNVVIPYSNGATDITILLENSSLTVDNNVNLKASGTSVISQGNAAISVVQPIPSEAAKIKIDIKTLSGDPVKSDEIILPATSKTISSIPSGQQYQFIVYAVDGSDNILAHRIAYKSVIENSTIAVNARLGVSIVNGKFIPNSPVIDHNSTFYWGNSDSTTYTVNFTFNGTSVSLTVPALNISNPSPSYVNYSFPLQAPAGNMAVALKNGAIVIDNGNLTVRKGNFSITVD